MDSIYKEVLPSILLIPEEIRGKIFNKLRQYEALKLRLVCQQWDKDVINYYNFSIQLHDSSPFFNKIIQLRIMDLQIGKLNQQEIQDPNNLDPSGFILKHQKLLRKLIISGVSDTCVGTTIHPDMISFKNLQQLLHNSAKYLTYLDISIAPSCVDFSDPTQQNFTYDFSNLKYLRLHRLHGDFLFEIANEPPFWKHCPFTFIAHSKIENLTGLDIYLAMYELSLSPQDFKLWSNLLLNQTHLEIINLTIPLDGHSFKSLVLNNSKTIVEIGGLTLNLPNSEEPFDFSIFETCHNLKEIILERGNGTEEGGDVVVPHLVNFSHLPKSLCKLSLKDLNILTRNILGLLNSDVVNGLDLELENCGIIGELGVNSEIIEKIMTLDNIKRVSVEGFNITAPGEVSRLNELFCRLDVTPRGSGDLDKLKFYRYPNVDNHYNVDFVYE